MDHYKEAVAMEQEEKLLLTIVDPGNETMV
ncbi:hypothetical protein AFERRI_600113 [Acidithiobacillus ferrivorans]|nr:hypothetical protein AFERRI_600113 [Acidithiobacillus ferrivorans]